MRVAAVDSEGMERDSVGREMEEGEGKGHGGGGVAGREEPRVGRQCSDFAGDCAECGSED